MPSEGQLILHLFLCHNNASSTQILFLGFFFSDAAFSSDLRMSVMIECVSTEGPTHCPSCASFESTENESSTLKNWVIHEYPGICPGLQIFFSPLRLFAPELSSMFFANIVNVLLQ